MQQAIHAAMRLYTGSCRLLAVKVERHLTSLLVLTGLILLTAGMHGISVADDEYITYESSGYEAIDDSASNSNVTKLIKGAFGSLVMVVAGLGAFVAAAMGAYKAAAGMLALAVGAFIARGAISVMAGYDDVKVQNR